MIPTLTKKRDRCTTRQARFVELIFRGIVRDIAYSDAGFEPKDKITAQKAASRLLTKNKCVISYLSALKESQDRKTNISRTMQLNKLNQAFTVAANQDNPSAMVSAIREQNEMLGYHRDTAPNPEREQARGKLIEKELQALAKIAGTRTAALSAGPGCKPIASKVKTKCVY